MVCYLLIKSPHIKEDAPPLSTQSEKRSTDNRGLFLFYECGRREDWGMLIVSIEVGFLIFHMLSPYEKKGGNI
jgi:hypothetical protein